MCQMLERAGQMHSQHQRQFFWKDPPELLLCIVHDLLADSCNTLIDQVGNRFLTLARNFISKALKMTLYIQLQEPVNIVFRQGAPAQPVHVSIDALVEVLSRLRSAVKDEDTRHENKHRRYEALCSHSQD